MGKESVQGSQEQHVFLIYSPQQRYVTGDSVARAVSNFPFLWRPFFFLTSPVFQWFCISANCLMRRNGGLNRLDNLPSKHVHCAESNQQRLIVCTGYIWYIVIIPPKKKGGIKQHLGKGCRTKSCSCQACRNPHNMEHTSRSWTS